MTWPLPPGAGGPTSVMGHDHVGIPGEDASADERQRLRQAFQWLDSMPEVLHIGDEDTR